MSRRGNVTFKEGQEHRRKFVKLFEKLKYRHSDWQVWHDFIYMAAAALSQPCNFHQNREDEYLRIINGYNKEEQELFPQMLAEIIQAFEQEKYADVLGELYMQLEMNNKWHGQFFTPYHVCSMMAKCSATDISAEIKGKGYMSVNDPCCGSGALLVAFAEHCFEQNVNYQQNILFVAQDIDPVVARMCFIQMSLLGMPGYVIIGNSLTQPSVGHALFPKIGKVNENIPDADIWYTPFFFTDVWHTRRKLEEIKVMMASMFNAVADERAPPPAVPEPEVKEVVRNDIASTKREYEQLSLF
ncbi:MAG: N-6 DNA methylase [Oscillospiraceae bacterium]|jgi:type I restriction-modification system DNA methylase subunit|nr:N-6 DNA methylase [Oscillospiraceae bacterium]